MTICRLLWGGAVSASADPRSSQTGCRACRPRFRNSAKTPRDFDGGQESTLENGAMSLSDAAFPSASHTSAPLQMISRVEVLSLYSAGRKVYTAEALSVFIKVSTATDA